MKTTPTLIAAIVALSLSSCHKVEDEKPAQAATASPKLQAVLDAEVEGEAQAIHIARKSAEPGQTLTLKGWVMGHDEPFVQGRAAFILGDPEVITACSERPGDGCTTPWMFVVTIPRISNAAQSPSRSSMTMDACSRKASRELAASKNSPNCESREQWPKAPLPSVW